MAHRCRYRIIFCTKYRRRLLTPRIADRFSMRAMAAAESLGAALLEIEVAEDRVSLLAEAPPDVSPKQVAGRIKRWSAGTLRGEFPELRTRVPSLWTNSSLIVTLGEEPAGADVERYLENQRTSQRQGQDGRMG